MEVLFVLIGIIIGIVGMLVYMARLSMGELLIDDSDSIDGPYLFLNIDKHKSVDAIAKKRRVVFIVEKRHFISQD